MSNSPTLLRKDLSRKGEGRSEDASDLGLDPGSDAFFFDVDGTLIDIAEHPDAVVVPAALTDALERLLARSSGAVALVSGRSVARLDALFAPLRLVAAGAHGAELRRQPEGKVEQMSPSLPAQTRAEALALAAACGDLFVEDKGPSIAIHYRSRPEVKDVLGERLKGLAARAPEPLSVLPGHFVFELKHAGRDKGVAIDGLMEEAPFSGRRPVFFGDDVTDAAGFDAVLRRGGVPVSVGRAFEHVNVVLVRPSDVRALVHRLSIT